MIDKVCYLYSKSLDKWYEQKHFILVNFIFFISSIIFIKVLFFWISYDPINNSLILMYSFKLFNLYWYFCLDGISLIFIFLTSFFIPICILFAVNQLNSKSLINDYVICLFSVEILLIIVFLVSDILLFFIFFEAILIPFFIIIAIKGSRLRKIHASYLLMFYTIVGSLFMLLSIIFIYIHIGSTMYHVFWDSEFSSTRSYIIWLTFFLSFGIKLPIFPFHIWLPEAHVESPTEASVILAAILLKVGSYGFLKILWPFLPNVTVYFSPLIIVLSSLSIIFSSMSTLRQIDIKRVIAYSSVAHMNVIMLGLLTFDPIGVLGCLLLMIGHGVVSGGMFLLIGMLYYRYHTKLITYYSGLVNNMPIFCSVFFLFVLGNISLPLTCNFVGEFLILYSILKILSIVGLVSISISIFLGTAYTMLLYNKISFGLNINNKNKQNDMTFTELIIMSPIIFLLFLIGIYPKILFDVLLTNIINYDFLF